MKYTSAQAAKLLKKLNEERDNLLYIEDISREFVAAVGEDIESVRPQYDYSATRKKVDEIEAEIRKLKHAINNFNLTHTVPGFDMTIDQMLIYIPQLNARKTRLADMKNRLPKARESQRYGGSSNIIDYRYVNYDIAKAEADFALVEDELSRAQTALDLINSTETMDIDL